MSTEVDTIQQNGATEEPVKIFLINNEQVMFEYDVAAFFATKVSTILTTVKSHPDRFPDDFLYQPTAREFAQITMEFPNSNLTKQNYIPLGFTEPGLAMLSMLLNTNEAIDYSVSVARVFYDLTKAANNNKALEQKVNNLEDLMQKNFEAINEALDGLCVQNHLQRTPIGFKAQKKD